MSGFANSIVGGVGALIRQYIKSPNYVPGVSGWSINKDGSAEFNNATFRGTVVISASGQELLVYNGTPAAGNLIASIAAVGGIDAYGNYFPPGYGGYISSGLSLFANDHNAFATPDMSIVVPTGGGVPISQIQAWHGPLALITPAAYYTDVESNLQINPLSGTLKVGSGPAGVYYYGEWYVPTQNVTTGAAVVLTGIGNNPKNVISDYPAPFGWNAAGNQWTCPITGPWEVDFRTRLQTGSPTQLQINVLRNGSAMLAEAVPSPFNGIIGVSGRRYLAQNDVLSFSMSQNTGATQTLIATGTDYSYVSIARRL